MKGTLQHLRLGDRLIYYRVVQSRTARKLRIRVSPSGVDVVRPTTRNTEEMLKFLDRNASWLLDQLDRVDRLRRVRRPERRHLGEILYRGEPTVIRIETTATRARGNTIEHSNGFITIRRGSFSQTPVAQSLENWLRKQARVEIQKYLRGVTTRLRHQPHHVYIMGQRTKWGNCSGQRNLSFNWRLILAPDLVLRYLVTHEAVHLAIPDHSAKFWLTVQSFCRETERAKQWLSANGQRLTVNLAQISEEAQQSSPT